MFLEKISELEKDLYKLVDKLEQDYKSYNTLLIMQKHQHDNIVEKDESFQSFGDELKSLIGSDSRIFTSKNNLRYYLRRVIKELKILLKFEDMIREFLEKHPRTHIHVLAEGLLKLANQVISNMEKLEANFHQQRMAVYRDDPKHYIALVYVQRAIEEAINEKLPKVLKDLHEKGKLIHRIAE